MIFSKNKEKKHDSRVILGKNQAIDGMKVGAYGEETVGLGIVPLNLAGGKWIIFIWENSKEYESNQPARRQSVQDAFHS